MFVNMYKFLSEKSLRKVRFKCMYPRPGLYRYLIVEHFLWWSISYGGAFLIEEHFSGTTSQNPLDYRHLSRRLKVV